MGGPDGWTLLSQGYITDRIRRLCSQRHMSMYALSKKTGISQSSLSNLMKRGSAPTFYTLSTVCDGLGITLAQFFSDGHEAAVISEEQKEVLRVWNSLSDEEREAVKTYVRGIKLA